MVIEEPVVGNEGVEAALAACADAGVQIERYLKGSGEPTIDAANTVTRAIVEDNCDAVIGIGGGSALDLAKAGAAARRRRRLGLGLPRGRSPVRCAVAAARALPDDLRARARRSPARPF